MRTMRVEKTNMAPTTAILMSQVGFVFVFKLLLAVMGVGDAEVSDSLS
jgi:hypothetical protein